MTCIGNLFLYNLVLFNGQRFTKIVIMKLRVKLEYRPVTGITYQFAKYIFRLSYFPDINCKTG